MLTQKAEIMDEKAMGRAIARISYEIIERNKGVENLYIVGILSRGAEIAKRIAAKISEVEKRPVEVGFLDITPCRDDRPETGIDRSEIGFAVQNAKIVLVDDVVFTGRSARAALDAILKRGRPQTIQLAALIDRGHRELPIRADFIGKNLPTSREEVVRVMMAERDGVDKVVILAP
ncbi:MAG: bifunctional pyr operon transcriptional regulator/uracil phosphoribosyltransferase PyrR [Oscillospiraceae bacterium]